MSKDAGLETVYPVAVGQNCGCEEEWFKVGDIMYQVTINPCRKHTESDNK